MRSFESTIAVFYPPGFESQREICLPEKKKTSKKQYHDCRKGNILMLKKMMEERNQLWTLAGVFS